MLVIYKEENHPIVTDDHRGLPGPVLKICTFKVGELVRGRKLGELFLQNVFRYATSKKIGYIYTTVRPGRHDFLQDLLQDFGFYYFGKYKDDRVYVKDHPPEPPMDNMPPLEYHKRYYPHFQWDLSVKKFLVPIIPEFHNRLFPECQRQLSILNSLPPGNAIKKAYLCHSNITGIKEGDLLLFYRSRDEKVVTTIGVVEYSNDYDNYRKIIPIVSKRTVYSYEEIEAMVQKRTKVILFRLAQHLPHGVPYDWLLREGVVDGQIQTIRRISHEGFQKIMDQWVQYNSSSVH